MDGAIASAGGGSSSSPGFAQQGSVDWVALSGSTLNFSVEILSRFSKAGVEMITVAMGQALFSSFRVRADGEQRFSDAISKLRAFSSYGKILWFGFGVKHIVRTLSDTRQGSICAAICACLSVSYDSLFSGKVLKALADRQSVPDTLTPSLSQWVTLVNVCAGAVTDSQFPKLVEGLSRLVGTPLEIKSCYLHEPTSAEALSGALVELAKVSNGAVRSVTLIGGVDCGWLAAIAQWLLSLSLDIVDENGIVLYSSRSPYSTSSAQVTILRCLSIDKGASSTKLIRRSFLVPPGRLAFDVRRIGSENYKQHHLFSVGRSDWSTILRDTFNQYFEDLVSPKVINSFAEFLHSGFAFSRSDGKYLPDPWGEGAATPKALEQPYLSFASKRLPELAEVCNIAQKNVIPSQSSFGQRAGKAFPNNLRRICPCDRCQHFASMKQDHRGSWCLERVAIAIFEYIWILSWLDIEDATCPSASGLRMLYLSGGNSALNSFYRQPYHVKPGFFDRPLVPSIFQLFTGHTETSRLYRAPESARCGSGVCVYSPALKSPTLSPEEQLRAVVVPGQIERNGALYEVVIDAETRKGRLFTAYTPSSYLQAYGYNADLKLVVEETLTSNVLEAALLMCSQHTRMQYHREHSPGSTNIGLLAGDQLFGPTQIRQEILHKCLLAFCDVHEVGTNASSPTDDRPTCWIEPDFADSNAPPDTYSPIKVSPRPGEWFVISREGSCYEVIRASYALYYTVICKTGLAYNDVTITSTDCFLCLLYAYGFWDGGMTKHREPCDRVVVHSFLDKGPRLTSIEVISNLRTLLPRKYKRTDGESKTEGLQVKNQLPPIEEFRSSEEPSMASEGLVVQQGDLPSHCQ